MGDELNQEIEENDSALKITYGLRKGETPALYIPRDNLCIVFGDENAHLCNNCRQKTSECFTEESINDMIIDKEVIDKLLNYLKEANAVQREYNDLSGSFGTRLEDYASKMFDLINKFDSHRFSELDFNITSPQSEDERIIPLMKRYIELNRLIRPIAEGLRNNLAKLLR